MITTTRNATLADLREILLNQHARKLDVIAPAAQFGSRDGILTVRGTEPIVTDDGVTAADGTYLPTAIFDEGIASKLDIPPAYLKRLRDTRPDLYDQNLNLFLHGSKPIRRVDGTMEQAYPGDDRKFLLRLFRGDEGGQGVARAFLSDVYSVNDHLDALTAAMAGVRDAKVDIKVQGCDLTDRRMYVNISAPEVSVLAPGLMRGYRSPFTGQSGADNPTVFAGFTISNSETGGGAFTIVPRITFQVCNNGMTITKNAMRAVHLGGRQDEGIRWSQDTNEKTLALITARARDSVTAFLDKEWLAARLNEMDEAANTPLTKADEVVRTVTKRLAFPQEVQDSVLDMFIQGGQITAGGVMQAVTAAAQQVEDADLAATMEGQALKALDLAAAHS